MWPAIFLGALLANLTTYGSLATSLCVGVGNTLEGLLGAMLVNRYAHGSKFFIRPSDIVMFTGLAVGLSTTVSPTVGLTSLALGGFAPWKDYGNIWLTWWLGDAAGDLIVAPVLVLWSTAPRPRWHRRRLLEAATLVIGLSLVALIVFDGLVPLPGDGRLPVQFLCAPFLFWAAFRLGRRAVATCVLVLAFIAILGTLRGLGPFAECLRASCRVTDTAARFGGDEFAIILPETSETGARQLVERINARLMADEESPRLSVSAGVAVYPRDGATAEKLLTSADRELYRHKAAARAATAAAAPVGELV